MTDSEIRTLELHRAVSLKIEANPTDTISIARRNLALMRESDQFGRSSFYFDTWQTLLDGSLSDLVRVMVSTDATAKELRQASPFSGILSDEERFEVLMATDGVRVAAKSGRPFDEVRREMSVKIR
jgi:hypothetical protein